MTQIRLGVFPGGIAIIEAHGFRKREIRVYRWRACEGQDLAGVIGSMLQELGCQGKPCYVVLSNAFSRFLVLDDYAGLDTAEERASFVAHHFDMVYGLRAGGWRKTWQSIRGQRRLFASATQHVILEQIERACTESGCNLRRVVPLFVAAHNRWRPGIADPCSFFLVAEPERLCAGALAYGKIIRIRSTRLRVEQRVEEIERLISQERLLLGRDWWEAPVNYCDVGGAPLSAAQEQHLGINVLSDSNLEQYQSSGQEYAALATL